MKHCAFLTLDEPGDFVIDDERAFQPMADLGWDVSTVSWRQTAMPWHIFDAVIIRSTWDYWNDVDVFLEVLDDIDQATHLANQLELVHWNLSKSYLRKLEQQGVAIVPTLWGQSIDASSIPALCDRLNTNEIVVKPLVGANGEDAFRICRAESQQVVNDIASRFTDRRCMVQEFMSKVISEGEYSLFYFNGGFSHAILKTPAPLEFRSQEERGARIESVRPEWALLDRGRQALARLPMTPLYARLDLVRDEQDDFVMMELELIEPSLYLRTDPLAPQRFAKAIDEWYQDLR